MNVWAAFGDKYEIGSHLPSRALYALAANSTPDAVRLDVIKRLKGGEKLTGKQVITRR